MPWNPSKVEPRGISLIELIIVVLILGILAAIVVPRYTSASDTTASTATAADLRSFQKAAGVYIVHNGGNAPASDSLFVTGIQQYLYTGATSEPSGIGGTYSFHSYPSTNCAAVGIDGITNPSLLADVDAQVDDGNLSTGCLRETSSNAMLFVVFGDPDVMQWP